MNKPETLRRYDRDGTLVEYTLNEDSSTANRTAYSYTNKEGEPATAYLTDDDLNVLDLAGISPDGFFEKDANKLRKVLHDYINAADDATILSLINATRNN